MSKVSLKKNFILNALLTISGIIFPIISFPYVSRILGPTGTGKVDFAASFISYFALFASLGIPTYGIRACAQVRDDRIKLSRTVHELITINAVMSMLSIIVFVPFLFFLPKVSSEKLLYIITASTLVLNVFGVEYLYKGVEDYSYITIRSLVFKFISLIAMFVFIHKESDYISYGAISVFASSASSLLNFIHSHKYIQHHDLGKLDYKRHFRPIAVFFAMSCAVSLYVSLDRVMLGFMTNDDEVGYYGSAVKIKSILIALVTSLGNVLMPRASYCVKQGMMDEFERLICKAMRFVFLVATPLFLFFSIFAKDGILFISGREYFSSIPAMQVITPTVLFIGITGLIGIQIFVPLGKEKYVLYSEIAGALTDIILNLILIPRFKATGAAMGTLAAEFVVLVVQLYLLYRIKNETPVIRVFKKISYWKTVIASIAATSASIWICVVYPIFFSSQIIVGGKEFGVDMLNSFVRLLIAALIFFGVYTIVMLLTKDEMMLEIISMIIKKLKRKDTSDVHIH